MILECAECHTRYLVPDSAIGPEGRLVRCANCKHSWHQPPAQTEPEPEPAAPVEAIQAEPVAAQEEASAPAVPAPAPAPIPEPETYTYGMAQEPPSRAPLRNPARMWTTLAVTAGVAMLAACAAILFVNTPSLMSALGIDLAPKQTPLLFAGNSSIDRHDLPSGNEYFAVKGAVVNPTSEHQHVPDIRVVLKDAHNRTVYSWSFQPAARDIAPKGTMAFDSAMIDVPPSSKNLVLTFSDDS